MFTWLPVALLFAARMVPAQQIGAQPSSSPLTGVVVVGSAPSLISPDVQTARQRVELYPGATSVVGSEDFDRGRGSYLEDYLRFTPGTFIQSEQGSEDTKVSIRGSGIQSDELAGLEILIDGVPLNQADGEAYLQDVDLQAVKFTEVYRGADAFRFGSIVLGGAINLVTVTGRDAAPFGVRLSYGSFGFTEQEITSGWSKGAWDGFVSIANHTLDGFRDHSQENSQKIFASLGYRGANFENRLYFFFGRLDQNNPSSLTKDDLNTNPRQTDQEAIDEDWNTYWTYERVVDRFVLQGDEWSLQLAAYWNRREVTQRQQFEDDYRLGTDRFYSNDYGGDFAFTSDADFLGHHNRFTVGFLPTFEFEPDAWYANTDGRIGSLLASDDTVSVNLSLYLENQFYLTKNLSILTGFQGAYVYRRFFDRLQSPVLGNQSHSNDFLAFNPKIGVSYEWDKRNRIYLNVSRSFQPPSFDESLRIQEGTDGGEVFNQLEAQKAITLELGTRGEMGPVSWDFAIYRSWIRDELLDLNNNRGEPLGTVNAHRTVHQGIELGVELELAHSLLVHPGEAKMADGKAADGKTSNGKETSTREAEHGETDKITLVQSYTLNDFRFRSDPAYGDNQIAGIPRHYYKAELLYTHPEGFYIGANLEWNMTRYAVDEANSLFVDPYALLGVRAGYKARRGFEVFFEAKNLTDKTYASSVEPIADARTGDDTDSFNPGNGRAFYGGVAWSW